MITLVSLALGLSILACAALEFSYASPAVIVWLALGAVFGVPHLLDSAFGHADFAPSTLLDAGLFGLLFNVAYLLIRVASRRRQARHLFEPSRHASDRKVDRSFVTLLAILYVTACVGRIVTLASFGGGLSELVWGSGDVSYGMQAPWIFLMIFTSGAAYGMLVQARLSGLLFCLTIGLGTVLIVRSRVVLIPLLLPLLVHFLNNGRGPKRYLHAGAIGLGLIIAVVGIQQIRYLGALHRLVTADPAQLAIRGGDAIASGRGEFALREGYYTFVERRGRVPGFEEGATYRRLAFLPIPSILLGDAAWLKPRDFTHDMWNVLHPERTDVGGSYHPLIYGDSIANAGWSGFLLGGFWALVISLVERLLELLPPMVVLTYLGPLSSWLALTTRGAVYNAAMHGFWGLVFLAVAWHGMRMALFCCATPLRQRTS